MLATSHPIMEIIRKEISVLLCFVAIFCLCDSDVGRPEVVALIDIKNLLVDPHGVLDDWDDSAPDPCSWALVTCSPDGLVVGLGVPGQDLSGTLSPSIGNLINIQSLLLQNNNISGDIPSQVGTLSKLQTIDLSNNNISGQIPSSLSNLNGLEFLRLNNNSLSGAIPDSLANLAQLNLLDLSFNNFSGPVPILHTHFFKIEGNPYICTDGTEKVECAVTETGLLPRSSSKAKLSFPPGIFYVILILTSCICC